jgi:hypothetical protein
MGGATDALSATVAFWESYYLDIKTPDVWATNTPSADPDKWQRSVITQLQIILKSQAGAALFRSMKRMAQWIDVHPLQTIECNAHGGFPGTRVIGGRWYQGKLQYNPDVYMSGSPCYKRRHRSFGKEPDQVLFHELIHAHRAASWLLPHHDKLIAGLSGYKDEEEFLAVVLTNIYISETKGKGLRADYISYGALKGPLSSSIGFFASSPQVLRILTEFAKDQEFLFNEMAKVKAPFNPLAAMKEHPDEVRKASYSKESMQRERTAPNVAAAQLERLKSDARHVREQEAKDVQRRLTELAHRSLATDLTALLADAALTFLPR